MAKDRFGEEIEESPARISASTVKCCLCRQPVQDSGWCENCRTYPINITPIRYCHCGHSVHPDGRCRFCNEYILSGLDPQPGEWMDTGRIPRRLRKEEMQELVQTVTAKLSGPGWPDKVLPARSDMIPHRWKHAKLKVVGQTPLGYDLVLPEGAVETKESDVPF